jgi:3-oxoacyl-[acyl-carrier protein] reductase|tara:strand:- start:54 stop:797 length:744 start_codon:yes stop_codon:yes gene_type:complete
MNFKDKVILVTGASRGIGAAIADNLGSLGSTVVATATSNDGAKKISERFESLNIKGEGHILDVSDKDSIDNIMELIKTKYEAPLILVNNAGITKDNILLRMKDEEWLDVMDTNLNAIYRLSKACLRGMTKARWGRIITIGSVVGSTGNPGQTNYSATKAGILGFTKSLARELGPRNITVNCVSPGFIDTDMTKNLPDASRDALLTAVPLGRFGNPDEVAEVVNFLAGDTGAYITGENIHVNGGMYMP